MTTTEQVMKWSTAGAVLGVAAVASYELVHAHGETGWTARLVSLTVGGLIYASSMVMLTRHAARRRSLRWRGGSCAWASRRRWRPTLPTA